MDQNKRSLIYTDVSGETKILPDKIYMTSHTIRVCGTSGDEGGYRKNGGRGS